MLSLLTTIAFLLLQAAAPDLPGGGGPITAVPIDGGLSLLAIAGGAYAVKRLRQRH